MRPCRDHTPEGFTRKSAKRWAWRARRIAIRLAGFRVTRLRNLFGDCVHDVPVYRELARRAWQ